MADWIHEEAKDTAKKVRKALKKAFPELPARHFRVTSDTYAGGSSVSVRWTDYPMSNDVNKVINQYKSSSFDGMQDLKVTTGYKDPDDGKLYNGADYIIPSYSISSKRKEAIVKYMEDHYGEFERGQEHMFEWQSTYNEVNTYFDKDNVLLPEYDRQAFEDSRKSTGDYTKIAIRAIEECLIKTPIQYFGLDPIEASLIGKVVPYGDMYQFSTIHKHAKDTVVNGVLSIDIIEKVKNHHEYSAHQHDFDKYLPRVVENDVSNFMKQTYKIMLHEDVNRFYKNLQKDLLQYLVDKGLPSSNPLVKEQERKVKEADRIDFDGILSTLVVDKDTVLSFHDARNAYISKRKRYFDNHIRRMSEKQKEQEEKSPEGTDTREINLTNKDIDQVAKTIFHLSKEHGVDPNAVKEKLKGMDEILRLKQNNPEKFNESLKGFIEGYVMVVKDTQKDSNKGGQASVYHIKVRDKKTGKEYNNQGIYPSKEDAIQGGKEQFQHQMRISADEFDIKVWKKGEKEGEYLTSIKEGNTDKKQLGGTAMGNNTLWDTELERTKFNERNKKQFEDAPRKFGFFNSKQELAEKIISLLIEGEVNLKVNQSKGGWRFIYGTRNPARIEFEGNITASNQFKQINSSNVKQEIESGTVALVDLGAGTVGKSVRFDVDNLTEYQINEDDVISVQYKKTGNDDNGSFNSSKRREVKFSNKKEVSETIVKALLKGEVNLEFTKANGEKRFMRGTRNTNLLSNATLVEQFNELNQQENIGKEINNGTIALVDLDKGNGGSPRKFVTERLISFQPEGKGDVLLVGYEESNGDAEKHYDPTKLKTQKIISTLNEKVVRLVFEKKDGTKRPMVATRNHKLVELYTEKNAQGKRPLGKTNDNSEQAIKAQIEKDYVTVLDLEKGEFRTFKPSKLVRYDEDNNISSWIEFAPNNDAWYDIAKQGADPVQYYKEGKKASVNIGNSIGERVNFENQRRLELIQEQQAEKNLEDLAESAKKSKAERTNQLERMTRIRKIAKQQAQKYAEALNNRKFERVYEEIKAVPEQLQNDPAFNNMMQRVEQSRDFDELKLTLIKVGDSIFYIHPMFIINTFTGRVYLDKTSEQAFSNLGKVYVKDADTGAEDVLEPLANKLRSVRLTRSGARDDIYNITRKNEGLYKRARRTIALAEKNVNEFAQLGVQLQPTTEKYGEVPLLNATFGGETYRIHPYTVTRVTGGSEQDLYTNSNRNAVAKEAMIFYQKWANAEKDEKKKKQIMSIGSLVVRANDLRKRVDTSKVERRKAQ